MDLKTNNGAMYYEITGAEMVDIEMNYKLWTNKEQEGFPKKDDDLTLESVFVFSPAEHKPNEKAYDVEVLVKMTDLWLAFFLDSDDGDKEPKDFIEDITPDDGQSDKNLFDF